MSDMLAPVSLDADAPRRFPAMRRLLSRLASWPGRYRQRLDLAELDDHLLVDIGVTRQEAGRESSTPFWR